eukprot:926453-Amphidinium_carterae.2
MLSYPLRLLRAILAIYRGQRTITWRQCMGQVVTVQGSIIAGDPQASTMMMLALYGILQRLWEGYQTEGLMLQNVMDDIRLHIVGHPTQVSDILTAAGTDLLEALRTERLPFSATKTRVLASSTHLCRELATKLGVEAASTATSLGHATTHTRRRVAARGTQRRRLSLHKLHKVRLLRRTGARVRPLVRAGPTASALWGSHVL